MLTDDIEQWNSLFPECQIRHSDLKHPTEAFLIKVLVVYLRDFGYKVEPPININTENIKETRAFLIRLARHTDYMLKISRKDLSFTYYELISPTAKKTSQTLNILLNYLSYYKWFKLNIFNMAKEHIDELDELKSQIGKNENINEELIKQNKQLREAIETLQEELPKTRTEHDSLMEQFINVKNPTEKLQNTIKELCEKLQQLKENSQVLLKYTVHDDESKELNLELEKLKKDVEEAEKRKAKIQNELIKRDEMIKTIEQISKDVKHANNELPKGLLNKWKSGDAFLKKAQMENEIIKGKRDQIRQHIHEFKKEVHSLKLLKEAKQEEIVIKEKEHKQQIAKQQESKNKRFEQLQMLTRDIKPLQSQLQEQQQLEEVLKENIAVIMGHQYMELLYLD